MSLEELERKKKELELRSQIASLERKEQLFAAASRFDWHLLWVIPCVLGSLIYLGAGIFEWGDGRLYRPFALDFLIGIALGIALLIPPALRWLVLSRQPERRVAKVLLSASGATFLAAVAFAIYALTTLHQTCVSAHIKRGEPADYAQMYCQQEKRGG